MLAVEAALGSSFLGALVVLAGAGVAAGVGCAAGGVCWAAAACVVAVVAAVVTAAAGWVAGTGVCGNRCCGTLVCVSGINWLKGI